MKKLMKSKLMIAVLLLPLMSAMAHAATHVKTDIELEKTNGGKTTLDKVMEGKKAMVIDIWATWCPHCIDYLPTLKKKEAKLGDQVAFVGMNVDSIKKADDYRNDLGIDFTWVVEPKGAPYRKALDVKSFPHLVVISPKGEVLFRGHPMDDGWEKALRQLGVKI